MNAPDTNPEPTDPFACLDDTLDEIPERDPRTTAEKRWLMEQRFVHGLLRAMHTADAEARQARVDGILQRLPARGTLLLWRRLAAAAAVLVTGLGLWFFLREATAPFPRAEAIVAKAVAHLGEPVDRRYDLSISVRNNTRHFELTARPGSRFLIEGESPFGRIKAGCDGAELWLKPERGPMLPTFPLAAALASRFQVAGVLDIGYFDLPSLVAALPRDCELRAMRREGGLVRVEATRLPARAESRVREAFLLVEEATGLVRKIEIHAGGTDKDGSAVRSVVFEYVGIVTMRDEDFRVPR